MNSTLAQHFDNFWVILVRVYKAVLATGKYRYPSASACPVALNAVRTFLIKNPGVERVVFCLYREKDLRIYEKLMQLYFKPEWKRTFQRKSFWWDFHFQKELCRFSCHFFDKKSRCLCVFYHCIICFAIYLVIGFVLILLFIVISF